LDQCPEEKGLKIYRGCPEIQDSPTMDDAQKLQNGEAVMVPSAFGNYVVTKKWLRLKNNRYEYSDYERTAYKPVSKNETVEKLNAFYGLQVQLPQQDPKPKPQGVKGPKTPKGNALTQAEEAELNQLKVIENNGGLLNQDQQRRKKELENIKGRQ
jgi:hypothetical protein